MTSTWACGTSAAAKNIGRLPGLETDRFWQANATDPSGAVIDENLGNGLRTIRGFDLVTGLIDYVMTGPGGGTSIQDLNYTWDKVANLTQRQDLNQSLTEIFQYDNLHRLDYSTLNSVTNLDLAYDALGNITSKTGVGSYTYHATKKHAVITAGSASYGYDANGNMTTRASNTIEWYSFNKPKKINVGSDYSELFYGPDRQRIKQNLAYGSSVGTLHYAGQELEVITTGPLKAYLHYVFANGRAVARFTNYNYQGPETRYLHHDHLDSVVAATSETGTLLKRYTFDAFGVRSQTYGSGLWTQKGFTGHEHLDAVGLIDMNGRVQDPVLGRFLSGDPFVQAPAFTQSFNRYSYVVNNPLTFVDPSGFSYRRSGGGIKVHCLDACGGASLSVSRGIGGSAGQGGGGGGGGGDGLSETFVGQQEPTTPDAPTSDDSNQPPPEPEQPQQECPQWSADRSTGDKVTDAIVGFGDAFLIPILVREAFDISGTTDHGSPAYSGGMISGTIWGTSAIALRGAAALGGTRIGHVESQPALQDRSWPLARGYGSAYFESTPSG